MIVFPVVLFQLLKYCNMILNEKLRGTMEVVMMMVVYIDCPEIHFKGLNKIKTRFRYLTGFKPSTFRT